MDDCGTRPLVLCCLAAAKHRYTSSNRPPPPQKKTGARRVGLHYFTYLTQSLSSKGRESHGHLRLHLRLATGEHQTTTKKNRPFG